MLNRTLSFLAAALVLVALISVAGAQPASAPSSAPASQPPVVPDATIGGIAALFSRPGGQMTQGEAAALLAQRMNQVLDLGARAERQYPDAENLHVVRKLMLVAADFLAKEGTDVQANARLLALADRILASHGPADSKVPADFVITNSRIAALGPEQKDQAGLLIGAMVDRYKGTDGETAGLVYGAMLATKYAQTSLESKYLDELQAGHLQDPGVAAFLRAQGRAPYVGQPFRAELTQFDGKKLTLPDDLKGKVVLVDFWASWCGPCVASMPELKRLYDKYKDQGFEVVGIDIDSDKADGQKFLASRNLDWIQTHSIPTAQAYGVETIPSQWLIGRDGKIITDSARIGTEDLIVEALKAPATQPATTSGPAGTRPTQPKD